MGCLTVGVVTKPFAFEGRRRMQQAIDSIENLRERVDTLIVVSNDKLLQIVPDNTPLQDAFSVADDILRQGVVGISEIIVRPGLINVDFADVRSVMADAGSALMGIGTGSGKTRAQDAAIAAISSPLLDFPIEKARGIVFNITGGNDMTLHEINSAAEVIYEAVDPNANIIFGALVDDNMENEISITVVATGFSDPGDTNQNKKVTRSINLENYYNDQQMFNKDESNGNQEFSSYWKN
jgi:cell division protein FtsZ